MGDGGGTYDTEAFVFVVFYCPNVCFRGGDILYLYVCVGCRALLRGTRVCLCVCVGMVTCRIVCNGVCGLVFVLRGDVCVMSCCGWGVSALRY